ncbi:hypothetical protein D0Z03_001597 [Geotrichum reessii]|nr:hypothetical protein D0Z03_001597 [Galactomyces reessii]
MVSSKNFISTAALVAAVAAVPFPEAVAQLPGATMQCHEACGNLILESRKCTGTECCSQGSPFMNLVPECLECGWQLWNYYGKYLTGPLGTCGLPTEPTGANPNAQTTTAPAEKPTTTASEPEPTKAPEQPAESQTSKPEEPTQSQAPKSEEPAQSQTPKSEEPAHTGASKTEESAHTGAPKTEAHSTTVSSVHTSVVTSAVKSTSVKFGNSTTVTETICTKSVCQTPQPSHTTIEQVNGATQFTVAGAIAVVAGVAALF